MAVLIRTRQIPEKDKELVYAYHVNPEKLDDEEKDNGVLVKSLPEKPDTSSNEEIQLYYNSETGNCFYETKDVEVDDDGSGSSMQDRKFQKEVIKRLRSIEAKLDGLESKIN